MTRMLTACHVISFFVFEFSRVNGSYSWTVPCRFDYVLIAGTLCFLKEHSETIWESAQVLRGEGSLIVCEIPRDSAWGRLVQEKGSAGHRFYKYAAAYSVEDVQRTLEYVGFRVVDTKATLGFGPGEHERVEEPSDNIAVGSFA